MTPVVESLLEQDFDFIINRTRGRKLPENLPIDQLTTTLPEHDQKIVSPCRLFQPTHSQAKDVYLISKIFYPLILGLKWMGCCPVKTSRLAGKDYYRIKYEFKWISLAFFTSFLLAACLGLLLVTWASNTFFDISFPVRLFRVINTSDSHWLNTSLLKGSVFVGIMSQFIIASMPLGSWVNLYLSWSNVTPLCTFFDNWPSFFAKFHHAFAPYYTANFSKLQKSRNVLCLVWFTPIVVLMLTTRRPNSLVFNVPGAGPLISAFQTYLVFGTRCLSYVRDLLLLQTVNTAYEQVRNGIGKEYGHHHKSISKYQVRQWFDLIRLVRKQAGHVERYISCQNLWCILETFSTMLILLSTALYLYMNDVLSGAASSNFIPFGVVCSVFLVGSLYWKAEIAERISKMEEAIAEDIAKMETDSNEWEARLEMKLICDLILDDPISIQVGHLFTLNKRLLLSYFSQLASYLVVMLQFLK